MFNEKVRKAIKEAGLYHYRIAEHIGVSEMTFCRLLRNVLSEEKENQIMAAIDELKAADDGEGRDV